MPSMPPGLTENSFGNRLGLTFTHVEAGISKCVLETEDWHKNARGAVHGGVPFTMIDTGMGAAVFSTLGEGDGCATIEIKISYLNPAVVGDTLVCVSRVVKRGNTVAFIDSEVSCGGVTVAKATGTYAVLPGAAMNRG